MKRLIAICLSLLVLVGFSNLVVAMSDSDKEKYLDWVLGYSSSTALAVAPNGCWDKGSGVRSNSAAQQARSKCYAKCKATCEIKDVDGRSDFIKQRTSPSSASSFGTTNEPKQVTRKTNQPCDDLICGKWRLSYSGFTWQVEVVRSSDSMWEFASRITDPGNKRKFGFKNGLIESRFNRTGDAGYSGEIIRRNALFSAGYFPYYITLQTENMFSSLAQGMGREDPIYGQRIGEVPKAASKGGGSVTQSASDKTQIVAVDNSLEIEYWKTIKDSNDPEEYQIY
ncbi:uncharacterized protein METZ01_LOCUS378791, partial [marine metagenome]